MANKEDIALMAHLMRRAGFGATRAELEARCEKGYDATVEELINPGENSPPADRHELLRYHPGALLPGGQPPMGNVNWMYCLLNTQRPLEEKVALFWHQVFATGNSKVDNCDQILEQINLFRRHGIGNYRDLLVEISKNPAMIFWLDQNENHKDAVNENFGRELLELFSLGVGNYTEVDVREASRAFTGWTFAPKIPRHPYNRFPWFFEYRDEDHDHGQKTFLDHTGDFGGEDIIDIVVQRPACHQFVSRHLYNFFVADEVQVPAWQMTPPRDPEAIDALASSFRESGFDMKTVLRTLFTSDFFKDEGVRFAHVKSPTEVVASTLRMVGGHNFPSPGFGKLSMQPTYMGQDLLNPPSVEGWHTGEEWINSGSLMARINFAADRLGDTSLPGVRDIIDRLKGRGDLSPEDLVDDCLDLIGPLTVDEGTRKELMDEANRSGTLEWSFPNAESRVSAMLQLIASTREFQFA